MPALLHTYSLDRSLAQTSDTDLILCVSVHAGKIESNGLGVEMNIWLPLNEKSIFASNCNLSYYIL